MKAQQWRRHRQTHERVVQLLHTAVDNRWLYKAILFVLNYVLVSPCIQTMRKTYYVSQKSDYLFNAVHHHMKHFLARTPTSSNSVHFAKYIAVRITFSRKGYSSTWLGCSSTSAAAATRSPAPTPASAAACHRQDPVLSSRAGGGLRPGCPPAGAGAPPGAPAGGSAAAGGLGGLLVLQVSLAEGALRMLVRPKWLLSHMDDPL